MDKFLLDSNVIIRLIAKDPIDQYRKAREIFAQAESGEFKLIIASIVIAECVYVLTSKTIYHLPKPKAIQALKIVLNQNNIILEGLEIINTSFEAYLNYSLDFSSFYLLAKNQIPQLKGIDSFDQKVQKLNYFRNI
jgi:predicted nucleic acid-binding protein